MSVLDRIPPGARKLARAVLPDRAVDAARDYIVKRFYAPGMVSRKGPFAFAFRRDVLHKPPVLHRLVVHLTDHCNLNCKGCTHFSNIAKAAFTDVEAFEADLTQLSGIIPDITEIYLLGGEPLLHPDVNTFTRIARERFPKSTIKLMSNGVLVPRMEEPFWQTLHENDIVLVCDLYPIGLPVEEITRLAETHGVKLEWTDPRGEFFKLPLDLEGTQDPESAFRQCRGVNNCPLLKDGRLYPCAYVAYIGLLKERFGIEGLEPTEEDSISIYEASAYEIMDFLLNPVPWCKHCDFGAMETYTWGRSDRTLAEWLPSEHECAEAPPLPR